MNITYTSTFVPMIATETRQYIYTDEVIIDCESCIEEITVSTNVSSVPCASYIIDCENCENCENCVDTVIINISDNNVDTIILTDVVGVGEQSNFCVPHNMNFREWSCIITFTIIITILFLLSGIYTHKR